MEAAVRNGATPPGHRCGFVAIIGRPNVGKSTLLNQLLGQKVAIVTPKPQTTRGRILGIKTLREAQSIFIDTPGMHQPRTLINRRMVEVAGRAAEEADVLLWVTDAADGITSGDRDIAGHLRPETRPLCVVLNKIDLVERRQLLPLLATLDGLLPGRDVIPVSARTAANCAELMSHIVRVLPAGPRLYDPETITDQTERMLVQEVVREQVLLQTREEVPYGVAVTVDKFEEKGKLAGGQRHHPRGAGLAEGDLDREGGRAHQGHRARGAPGATTPARPPHLPGTVRPRAGGMDEAGGLAERVRSVDGGRMSNESNDALPCAARRRLPVIAIVGRPNVGKSTFFNRLVRAQRAIVDSRPGVTRDRNIAIGRWREREFLLVDTGGYEDAEGSSIAAAVRAQSALAAEQADAVIAVFDGRAGLNPVDRELVLRLRRLRKPVLYAVNKLDTPAHDDEAAEFFALGPSAVFPVAAAHGRGIDALMQQLFELLPAAPSEEVPVAETGAATSVVTLAIVGKPNVGKSSLLNRLVGSERAIVDAAPGTTRDPVDTPFRYGEQDYLLVDTAGIRHRPRVHEHIERACAVRALRAIERAEVALVVMDATQAISDQDARIAGYAWERGRALLFVVNKWDAVPKSERRAARFVAELHARYASFAQAPAVFVSARTGTGIAGIFPAVQELVAAHRQQLRTVELNKVLADATRAHAPPSVHGKRPRFYYATQTATAPPTITIFASAPQLMPVAYERYLANAFRAAFRLRGTPLRLRFRQRERRQ